MFNRAGTPYCDASGAAFGDNQFRFALLSLAACEAPLILPIGGFRDGTPPGFPYGESISWVANDWHAGLVPLYLAHRYRPHGVYKNARCLLAIHNLSHQGVEPASTFDTQGMPGSAWDDLSWRYPDWAQVKGDAVNLLKGAALASVSSDERERERKRKRRDEALVNHSIHPPHARSPPFSLPPLSF